MSWNLLPEYLSIFISFTPLLFIENFFYKNADKYKSINIFFYSFITFLLWHLFSAWWIFKISIIGASIVVLLNSILMASTFQIYHVLHKKFTNINGIFLFVITWLSFEYLHYHWFLSWPWFNLGNILSYHIKFIQWYEYTGVLGGSLWILLINYLFYLLFKSVIKNGITKMLFYDGFKLSMLILIPIFISLLIYSNYKEKESPIEIGVLQANINPYTEKFSNTSQDAHFMRLITLTDNIIDTSLSYILAPETSIIERINEDNLLKNSEIKRIKEITKKYTNLNFIIGAFTTFKNINGSKTYNSALQINKSNKIQIYHKSKLVLGSETVPFPAIFGNFESFLTDQGSSIGCLGTQEKRTVFDDFNQSIKIAPVVCYESIYGEFVSGFVKNSASLIFIITNDGYFEDSHGTELHFLHSKLRAIETRRSVARSANTGISGFINQRGDVLLKTKYGEIASLKHSLNTNNYITVYTKYGDYIGLFSLVLFVLVILMLFVEGYKLLLSNELQNQ